MTHDYSSASCPFCEPLRNDGVFESCGNFCAIYNIAPILPGHSLIVPKRHVESLMELSDDEVAQFMLFGRDVAKLLMRAFRTTAFNWTIQEKEAAGQTVSHLHMHIIPRVSGDLPSPGDWFPLLQREQEVIDSSDRKRLTSTEMANMISFIKGFRC